MRSPAAYLAVSSARRPWVTIAVWILTVGTAVFCWVSLLSSGLTTEYRYLNDPDSVIGERLLEERFRGPRRLTEIVVVQSDTHTITDPQFEAVVQNLAFDIGALGQDVVLGVSQYYISGNDAQVSADGHATVLPVTLAGSLSESSDNVREVMDVVRDYDGRDGFTVLIAGEASVAEQSSQIASRDLIVGESIGGTVALVILVLVFGAIVAALVPVAVAVVSIVVAVGAAALVAQLFELSFFVTNMITMIGLAVGIDYTLLIVSRFRDERAAGLDKLDAIFRTSTTACRAVVFSGFTVVFSLVGLVIVPSNVFVSLGLGAMIVVAVSVIAAVTLLPAILSLLGDSIDRLTVPVLTRSTSMTDHDRGVWDRLTRSVMKHPVVSIVAVVVVLVALASPAVRIETGFNGVETMPDRLVTKRAYTLLEERFSFGMVSPAEIVIDAALEDPGVETAVSDLQAAIASDPDFTGDTRVQLNLDRDVLLVTAPVSGHPDGPAAQRAVHNLRDEIIPETFGDTDVDVYVTGGPAFGVDFLETSDRYAPIVFAVVLGLSFVLLAVAFRSIVVPLKAIVMNLLSVGAAYGLLVIVFQYGLGAALLGFEPAPVVDAWIPLFLFSILFGLSMDYHVFLLSRVREHYDQTGDNTASVSLGLRTTGRIITGAALIMVAVFGGFAMGELVVFQQIGFGLAVAILLDATIIRSVLVPAAMQLLGDANWYFPGFLRWIPDVRVEPHSASEAS